jgi:16S rRNA (cytosine967-C5)-methyltransferase
MEQHQPNLRRALWKIILHNDMPTRVLGDKLRSAGFSSQDQAFARELLSGSIRWRLTLDVIAQAHTKGRLRNELALHAIRLGLYQLLCMNSVADHAAINETIDAAKPELGNEKNSSHTCL